jgi:hypothetical protein
MWHGETGRIKDCHAPMAGRSLDLLQRHRPKRVILSANRLVAARICRKRHYSCFAAARDLS